LYQSKAFYNPDILEKLITFCDIVEIGSNYPKDLFDPQNYETSDVYDVLAKVPEAKPRNEGPIQFETSTKQERSSDPKGGSGWDKKEIAPKIEVKEAFNAESNAYAKYVQDKKRQAELEKSGHSDKKKKA